MRKTFLPLLLLFVASGVPLQAQFKEYNLSSFYQWNQYEIYNRSIGILEDDPENAVKLSENAGEGIVWLNEILFENGIIEIDLKGQDVFQKSFLGIAFHGVDNRKYEAVYFRPFNFNALDSSRKSHAVQYISHPAYTWRILREKHPGLYEKGIRGKQNGNDWFHARIEISDDWISVVVNQEVQPSLQIRTPEGQKGIKLGLWVGDGSGGIFANLKIKPTAPTTTNVKLSISTN